MVNNSPVFELKDTNPSKIANSEIVCENSLIAKCQMIHVRFLYFSEKYLIHINMLFIASHDLYVSDSATFINVMIA